MRKKNVILAKISALTLSALITIAFMPILGGSASYAEEAGDQVQEELVTQEAPELEEEELEPGVVEVPDGEAPDVFEEEAAPEVEKEPAPAQPAALPEGDGEGEGEGEGEEAPEFIVINPGDQLLCEVSGGDAAVYKFTAPKTATYFFYASEAPESVNPDPVGSVNTMNSNGEFNQIVSNDDTNGRYFRMTFDARAGQTYYLKAWLYDSDDSDAYYVNLAEDTYSASITVSLNKKTGIATVKGKVVGDQFSYLYVDGSSAYDVDIYGKTSFTAKVDMKDYDIGYHEISASLYDHSDVYYKKAVPTYIYKKPSNSTSYYETGYKKIAFTYGGDSYKNCNLVIQYKKSGAKKWKKGKTVKPGNTATIKKLGAKKKYSVRTYFFATTYYKGKKYTFTGKSKPSKAVTVKTGGGKLKVKKVTVTKAKVESRTGVSYEWRSQWLGTMLYMYRVAVPYNYQVTTVTVTVKLKKKPGAAGVSLNGIKVKGNKKTYKTQMTFYGSLIGKKVKIKIQSYQSSKYGGYSKTVTKSAKVKK